jgi:acetyl-CoA acetyltransferase
LKDDIYISGAASWVAAETGPTKETPAPERWYDKPARLSRMDRLCALALVAADGALVDAGRPKLDPERTAVVFGSAYGCHATNEDYYRGLLREGVAGASPRLFAYTLPSSPAGEISIHYGIRGPATTACPGWQAGIAALAEGLQHLRTGRADRVIVVAAEVSSDLLMRLTGGPVRDVAAAVVLEPRSGRARIGEVEETFGDDFAERSELLAAAPLVALTLWCEAPSGALQLHAADPGGGAARVTVEA